MSISIHLFHLNVFEDFLKEINFDLDKDFYALEAHLLNPTTTNPNSKEQGTSTTAVIHQFPLSTIVETHIKENEEDILPDGEMKTHSYYCVSYPWSLSLRRFFNFLRPYTQTENGKFAPYFWLDIVCINQQKKSIRESLKLVPLVYQQSSRHFILTTDSFQRGWCLLEIAVVNAPKEGEPSAHEGDAESTDNRGGMRSELILSHNDLNLIGQYFLCSYNCFGSRTGAQFTISEGTTDATNTSDQERNLAVERRTFDEICAEIAPVLGQSAPTCVMSKDYGMISRELNYFLSSISLATSLCSRKDDKKMIESRIAKLYPEEGKFDILVRKLFVFAGNRYIDRAYELKNQQETESR